MEITIIQDLNMKNKKIKMAKYNIKFLISKYNMEQRQYQKQFFKNI